MDTVKSLEHLDGILSATISAFELIGTGIEDEKKLDYSVTTCGEGYKLNLTHLTHFEESTRFAGEHVEKFNTQSILVRRGDKVHKVVRDLIAELEVIYNLDLPELKHAEDFHPID